MPSTYPRAAGKRFGIQCPSAAAKKSTDTVATGPLQASCAVWKMWEFTWVSAVPMRSSQLDKPWRALGGLTSTRKIIMDKAVNTNTTTTVTTMTTRKTTTTTTITTTNLLITTTQTNTTLTTKTTTTTSTTVTTMTTTQTTSTGANIMTTSIQTITMVNTRIMFSITNMLVTPTWITTTIKAPSTSTSMTPIDLNKATIHPAHPVPVLLVGKDPRLEAAAPDDGLLDVTSPAVLKTAELQVAGNLGGQTSGLIPTSAAPR
mmetsp:Transcript_34564/g.74540  ORF Transcript_34564/g.74540 Transcript_34564/m.74540 type:complete len:260 (+) Transcript_34564:447-1226(+)